MFSNIGLNHRVGPNRLYVELARTLAAAGFRSLRFDLSGFGDSEPRRDGGTYMQRATLDTREALDFLEQRGSERFVLVGLCSGVDSAHAAALQDMRVVGGIFIEGYVYRNPGFWLRFWTVRYLQPARWRRYVRLRIARLQGQAPKPDVDELPEIFAREFPSKPQFAADLATLADRSVKMLFVYTINADGHYNYAAQFHETFGYRDSIDVTFYTRADHVFSTEAHRRELLTRIVRWMNERFPGPATVSGAKTDSADAISLAALSALGWVTTVALARLTRIASETALLSA